MAIRKNYRADNTYIISTDTTDRTGKWLAEQLGKNEATVSRWCSNSAQPSLEMLIKIAQILNVDPRELISGNGKK